MKQNMREKQPKLQTNYEIVNVKRKKEHKIDDK